MTGLGAKSRSKARKAKAKQAAKKATRQTNNYVATLPKVSEDDLLAFQLAHFGDDSQPENWFVDAETAMNGGLEEDDLGYYDDGVKRTLTDEQIEIFRRTELFQLEQEQKREKELQAEAEAEVTEAPQTEEEEAVQRAALTEGLQTAPREQTPPSRPVSRKKQDRRDQNPLVSATANRPWQRNLLESNIDKDSWKSRRYQQMVPYEERNKRNWEQYIEVVDPVVGSKTSRRIARDLDDQKHESMDMDY